MPIPKEGYADQTSHPQLDRWQRSRQLSLIRERCRQIGKEIFELCCQLQERFDIKDVQEALVLVAELKTLRVCMERLTQVENVDLQQAA